MLEIQLATGRDFDYWMSMDGEMEDREVRHLICNKRCYIVRDGEQYVGIMRYGLLWDSIPFLNLIYLGEQYRRNGYGSHAMTLWEDEMRALGYPCVLTSAREAESAQVFFMKLGYKTGGYLAEIPCIDKPREVFFIKEFKSGLKVVGK